MRELRQRETLAFRARRQQQRAHRSALADADRRHVGSDELHRVVDRHPGRDRAAGLVDVEIDVFLRVFGFEKEKLRDDQVGDLSSIGVPKKMMLSFKSRE